MLIIIIIIIISGGASFFEWGGQREGQHIFRGQVYRVAQKSKPLPIFQKIVLKIANEIRFLRKVKESSTIIQSVGNKYSV